MLSVLPPKLLDDTFTVVVLSTSETDKPPPPLFSAAFPPAAPRVTPGPPLPTVTVSAVNELPVMEIECGAVLVLLAEMSYDTPPPHPAPPWPPLPPAVPVPPVFPAPEVIESPKNVSPMRVRFCALSTRVPVVLLTAIAPP